MLKLSTLLLLKYLCCTGKNNFIIFFQLFVKDYLNVFFYKFTTAKKILHSVTFFILFFKMKIDRLVITHEAAVVLHLLEHARVYKQWSVLDEERGEHPWYFWYLHIINCKFNLFLQEEEGECCGRVHIFFWIILKAGHIFLGDPVDE